MADLTGGELVARVLAREGVGAIFTLCGGHILPIYDACLRHGIRIIDVRHEQAAAHAADAWARLTRGLGVAVVVPGPGVTDAVTGVANAHAARSPLLLIGGGSPLGLKGRGALQEMDQVSLLRPSRRAPGRCRSRGSSRSTWRARSTSPSRVSRARSSSRSPSTSSCPRSTSETRACRAPGPRDRPAPDAERSIASPALLAAAERPGRRGGERCLLGRRRGPRSPVSPSAPGLPVFTNGMGRGCLPHDHPMAFQLARGPRASRGRRGPRPRDPARLPARLRPGAGVRGGGAGRDGRRGRRRLRTEPDARRGHRGRRPPDARGLARLGAGATGADATTGGARLRDKEDAERAEAGGARRVGPDADQPLPAGGRAGRRHERAHLPGRGRRRRGDVRLEDRPALAARPVARPGPARRSRGRPAVRPGREGAPSRVGRPAPVRATARSG